jgi:zona occludens toxin
MIYLITGVPGSGKTLYAVSTLLQKLLKETVKGKDGVEVKRRLCIDGIPKLIIPHELMADRPEQSLLGLQGQKGEGKQDEPDGNGLWNWWKWCRPGDVLVCDEVQRHWRPRGMGTKVPEEIAMLETHRHFGVDLVLITQNPMLVDQNVRRLVGRHLNVRRLFGGARALIYDWDGCQTDVTRTSGAVRTLWTYPKDAYKLYASSELHTKQHQKIPVWFAFPLVVLALGAFAGPKAYDAMHRTMTGKGLQPAATPASAPRQGVGPSAPASEPRAALRAASAAAPAAAASQAAPAVSSAPVGCIATAHRCECYGSDGMRQDVDEQVCHDGVRALAQLVPLDLAPRGGSMGHRPMADETRGTRGSHASEPEAGLSF